MALEAKGDKEVFFNILTERLDLAADVGLWRYNRLITLKAKEASFSYIGGVFGMQLQPEDSVEKVFADGRGSISIGFLGAYETVLALTGKDPVFDQGSFELQKEIMLFIRAKIDGYKESHNKGFSLYSSPSESLTERFCELDRAKFGDVKGITDKGFYVNSYHVNTEAGITPFEKIDFESHFQPISSGGHVSFVEMGNMSGNLKAYEAIVKYAHDKKLMYIGVNSPWDFCKTCHWTGGLDLSPDTDFQYICPCCGETNQDKIVLTRRLCGYLSTTNKRPPVAGRIKEILSRVKHG